MTARRATVGLLAAFVGICAWMYLRDRVTPVRSSERTEALADASRMLDLIASPRSCGNRCGARVLGRAAPRAWRVQLSTPTWSRCFIVRLDAFGYSQQHGVGGVQACR
jgi:hypothetical protein